MFSRKFIVVMFMVLTICYGLSANKVLAQTAGVQATDASNPGKESIPAPAATSTGSATSEAGTTVEKSPATLKAITVPVQQKSREEGQKYLLEAQQKYQKEMQKYQQDVQKAQQELQKAQMIFGKGFDVYGARSTGGRGLIGEPFIRGAPITPFGAFEDEETKALQDKESSATEETEQIVNQYNSTQDKAEREKLKKKLEEVVSQQFQIRQQYREMQVKRLEEELARIRESIQKRTENREQIVKRRIAQLLHEEEDLEF